MKKPILLLMILLSALGAYSQVIDRPTLTSAGQAYLLNGAISIQSTLGETVISTIKLGNTIFTQGFQQPEQLINLPSGRTGGTLNDLVVYPNPAIDQIYLKFSLAESAMVKATLYNKSGKIVASVMQNCGIGIQEIPFLFNLPSGLYVLNITYKGYAVTTKVLVQ